MKISDQVDRNNPKLIEAVFWSSLLDNVFKENFKNDPELRYCTEKYLLYGRKIICQLINYYKGSLAVKTKIPNCPKLAMM